MAATLSLILISSLLQGGLCRSFRVTLPQNIKALSGSCVTIPCSFDVDTKYDKDLNDQCKACWSDTLSFTCANAKLTPSKITTGVLTQKNCTTTFNTASRDQSSKYYFRVDCNKKLIYTFTQAGVDISITGSPPSPTLTPSTLKVEEGTSVSLMCSAPAPCWSHPPALTWTPDLGQSQEALEENQDKTKAKTSVVTFTASRLHHGKKISCTAVYKKQDGSTDAPKKTSLTPVISYPPRDVRVSVSPSGPAPENRTLTLTCSSNANPAVRTYSWYRADGDQETLTGTGTTLNTEVSRNRRIFFCKAENEIGVGRSSNMKIDVQFPPQILLSSACNTTTSQVSCSCETVGNPSPTVQWYLNGLPVNKSGTFEILSETLNSTALRSFFTLNQPHKRDVSTVRCRSFNSLGSASQHFSLNISAEHQVLYRVIISTLAVSLPVLICVLLFVIRSQKNHCKPKGQLTDENSTVASSCPQTREGNEASNTTEECIYANTDRLRGAEHDHPATIAEPSNTSLPSFGPNNAEGGSENSGKKGDRSEVIYSDVIWKTKSKKEKKKTSVTRGSSHLEEENTEVGGINRNFVSNALEMGSLYDEVEPKNESKEVECHYAQVKFKKKGAIQK